MYTGFTTLFYDKHLCGYPIIAGPCGVIVVISASSFFRHCSVVVSSSSCCCPVVVLSMLSSLS